jgi:hypothetical protein
MLSSFYLSMYLTLYLFVYFVDQYGIITSDEETLYADPNTTFYT